MRLFFGSLGRQGDFKISKWLRSQFPITHMKNSMQQTIVKTYKGKQQQATAEYQKDAVKMAAKGYTPTSQVWTPGTYGCGSFLVALALCVVFIGVVIFVYMLIVKPPGTLTVTYSFAPPADQEKTCPKCAEKVKAAATVCRYCGHAFDTLSFRDH